MAKENPWNRMLILKEGIWEPQKGRKNKIRSKNMDKYNTCAFSSWVFQIIFDAWSKNYNVSCSAQDM